MNADWRNRYDAAQLAAQQAGQFALQYFDQGIAVEWKADQSPVTMADRGAEDLVRKALLGNFPGDVPLTNPAVNWDSQVIIPGGETGPGKRTPDIWAATILKKPVIVEEEPEAPTAAAQEHINVPPVEPENAN